MDNLKNTQRTYELDLIRFIAALCVVIYHYKSLVVASMPQNLEFTTRLYSITKFGYLGVDLFFIISGFVIFASANNRTWYQFSVSRIVRIYPTFWVCLTLTSVIILLSKNADSINIIKYLTNLTLFHTYLNIESIDGVYWTLVTEIKFYICIFLLLYFKYFDKYKIWIPIWLVLTILFFVMEQPFFLGWFISPYYSPYFISGIIFYLAKRDGYSLFHIIILLVSLILACNYAYEIIDSFSKNISNLDRVIAVLIVCGFYLLFFMISLGRLSIKKYKYLPVLGGMTYPLYLLHNLMGKTFFHMLNEYLEPIPLIFMISAVIILLSYIVHTYFEKKYSNNVKNYLLNLKR